MTPLLTINLIRTLFIAFSAYIGAMVGEVLFPNRWLGAAAGLAFGLAIVLADRLLKGVSLRLFSSATFGLLMGTICARLLFASDILRDVKPDLQWVISLAVYAGCAYLGAMLAVRSNRQDFSLIIPYVRFRQTARAGCTAPARLQHHHRRAHHGNLRHGLFEFFVNRAALRAGRIAASRGFQRYS